MNAPAILDTPSTTRRFRPSFYFWMTLAMCLFVFAGFGIHSFLPALQGNFPPAPPIVHLHGVVFVAWMLLLLTQSALVCSGNVKLHRALGIRAPGANRLAANEPPDESRVEHR